MVGQVQPGEIAMKKLLIGIVVVVAVVGGGIAYVFLNAGDIVKQVVEEVGSDATKTQVTLNKEKKDFHPEEISSMVLGKMKEIAETYIGSGVQDAVITVPTHYLILAETYIGSGLAGAGPTV